MLPEKWTGRLVGKMHCNRVTYDELAEELGVTKAYVSLILMVSNKCRLFPCDVLISGRNYSLYRR